MPRKKIVDESSDVLTEMPEAPEEVVQTWTPEQLLAVKHLGPALIGEAMHKAALAYDRQTTGGKFGPALL